MSKPLGKPDRIVVALGGNALGNNPVEQIEAVSNTAHALLGLIEQGNEIIITHGNGPQVGMIQNAFAAAHDAIGTPEMPLPECGAMSQGYIGYHLQQGIGREMHKRYKRWHAATVVTQIECDPDDPAFKNPTKPIGPFYTEEQAKEFMAEDPSKVFVEDSGRGWRRVVASPDPKKIVEADSILNLLDNEFIVIACGGGGIPVVRDYENKGCYKGVPAVIDKDLGGELLAEDCDADVLFLLTAVEHVAINFGKPNQEELEELTADEAERLADDAADDVRDLRGTRHDQTTVFRVAEAAVVFNVAVLYGRRFVPALDLDEARLFDRLGVIARRCGRMLEDVVGERLVQLRRTGLHGLLHVQHERQHVVLDLQSAHALHRGNAFGRAADQNCDRLVQRIDGLGKVRAQTLCGLQQLAEGEHAVLIAERRLVRVHSGRGFQIFEYIFSHRHTSSL